MTRHLDLPHLDRRAALTLPFALPPLLPMMLGGTAAKA